MVSRLSKPWGTPIRSKIRASASAAGTMNRLKNWAL
jgi:hypothetical protein